MYVPVIINIYKYIEAFLMCVVDKFAIKLLMIILHVIGIRVT